MYPSGWATFRGLFQCDLHREHQIGISKLAVIFQWVLFAATVGLALGILQKLLERFGFIGQIVTGTLGFMWSVVVFFVMLILVYENVWPVQTVHRSKEVLRETWGESLFRRLGLGIIQLLCVLAVMAVTLVLVKLIPLGLGTLLVITFGVVISLSVILVFAVANTILIQRFMFMPALEKNRLNLVRNYR